MHPGAKNTWIFSDQISTGDDIIIPSLRTCAQSIKRFGDEALVEGRSFYGDGVSDSLRRRFTRLRLRCTFTALVSPIAIRPLLVAMALAIDEAAVVDI